MMALVIRHCGETNPRIATPFFILCGDAPRPFDVVEEIRTANESSQSDQAMSVVGIGELR